MGNRPGDRMNDPYCAQLLFQIEQTICNADKAAQAEQIVLYDSHIKSVLNKIRKLLRGKSTEMQ